MLGSFVGSILPTSQVMTFVTGSKEYFPWFGVRVTFRMDLGNGTSNTTFSILKKEKKQKETKRKISEKFLTNSNIQL